MKRLLITLLFIPLLIGAQPQVVDYTKTNLGSNATFTGTLTKIQGNYNYLIVTVKSDKASATNGLVVRWTESDKPPITWTTIDKRSYTASDSLNGANVYRFPIAGSYFKVYYTNTSSAQTSFKLSSYLVNETKKIDVTGGQIISSAGIDSIAARVSRAFVTTVPIRKLTTKDSVTVNGVSFSGTVSAGYPTGVIMALGTPVSVGVTATQLTASSTPCKFVRLSHLTDGAIVYNGYSNAVTTTNGVGYLQKADYLYVPCTNANQVWLISTVAGTDMRWDYGN